MNFIQIQNSHSVSSKHAVCPPYSTGYEYAIAGRVSDTFACLAEQDAEVMDVNDKAITVKYKDGSTRTAQLGVIHGKTKGTIIPHNLTTTLKKGDKIKAGHAITFNSLYFTPDALDPGHVIYKSAVLLTMAYLDGNETFEDSIGISEQGAMLLHTPITEQRHIRVAMDQVVHNLVNIGETVKHDSILCIIEDPTSSNAVGLSESTLKTLSLMASNAPKAKYNGLIENIVVTYNGDIEDMSESVKAIVLASDKRLASKAKALKEPVETGLQDATYRVENKPLVKGFVDIAIYITDEISMGIGDKVVVANQLKGTIGHVMTGVNITAETNEPIQLTVSRRTPLARITTSPDTILTTNAILVGLSKIVADQYEG